MLLDLEGMNEDQGFKSDKLILVSLWGKVKGEDQVRRHKLPCCNKTDSGIPVRLWVERSLRVSEGAGRTTGPLMTDRQGKAISSNELNLILHEMLENVYQYKMSLFPESIKDTDDIKEKYSVFRTFRRGSNTRAQEMGIDDRDVNLVNHWSVKEKAGARKPAMDNATNILRHHYAHRSLLAIHPVHVAFWNRASRDKFWVSRGRVEPDV